MSRAVASALTLSGHFYLANNLGKEVMGIIAMIAIFFGFFDTFLSVGFSQALIQKKGITKIQQSTVYWLNVVLGIILSSIIFFEARNISYFLGQPNLVTIFRILFQQSLQMRLYSI